jgi:ferredoxin
MKNLLKKIVVITFITIMTTVIYAFNRFETTLESDVAYTIEFYECIGCGACTEYGTALVAVSGYIQNDVAVWTSTYTRMEGNARDHLLITAPQTELDLAEEAKDQCPVGAIY